jgi:hypothetical protein
MEREQLIEGLEQATDEQKAEMLSWLNHGRGHSVASLDYYTDKGIPAELVEPLVSRNWSNFVAVPKGITKVAEDVITNRPIGWFDSEDKYGPRSGGWKFLLTPQEEENGFLSDGYRSIAESRTKQLFVEDVAEGDYLYPEEEWDEYIKTHRLHPKASYWSHHWENVCGGCLTIEYYLPVTPKVDRYDDNKEYTYDVEDSGAYYIVKYDGRKRTDFYCLHRLVNYQRFMDEGPLTMEAAIERAEAGIAERTNEDGTIKRYLTIGGGETPEYYTEDGFQPVESIAKEYIKFNEEEREWKQRRLDKAFADVPDVERWVKAAKVPPMQLGQWCVERFVPMGYMDVMWGSGHWMTPWVDGVGSHTVINVIKRTLGDEEYSQSLGRGSGARQDAKYLLTYMRENNIVFGDEEE